MWKIPILLLILTFSGFGMALPSCMDLNAHYALQAADYRSIAQSCPNSTLAELYYHRAYYAELLQRAEAYAGLESEYADRLNREIYPHRVYMVLVEELARDRYPDLIERARYLSTVYEHQSQLAELRIGGYENRAELLLHRFYHP